MNCLSVTEHVCLTVALRARREAKVVAHGRARDVEPASKGLAFDLPQVFLRRRLREVIRGEFGSVQVEFRAIVDEVDQRQFWRFGLQQSAVTVCREAQFEMVSGGACNRLDGAGGGSERGGTGHGGQHETASVDGT